jgi:hypothetical protein
MLQLTVNWPADSQQHTARTNCYIHTLLPPDDGQLAGPKHVRVDVS